MIKEIVSGGQTGADRAGLDAAAYCYCPTGGWAAKGWLIQTFSGQNVADLSLQLLGLEEYFQAGYPPRTKANVQDSDGTVWFGYKSSPGGKLTCNTARRLGKPLVINPTAQELIQWAEEEGVEKLNVAGNRASALNPDIYLKTFRVIMDALKIQKGLLEVCETGESVYEG